MAGGRKSRTKTRRLLVQAYYQAQLAGHDLAELRKQFTAGEEFAAVDAEYFAELLQEIDVHRDELDVAISAHGPLEAGRLDPVEHAVLWVALAELRFHPEVPAKVVINEAIELTKTFGAEGGHKYINALLDNAAAERLNLNG